MMGATGGLAAFMPNRGAIRMFKTRLLSGIILLAITILLIHLGGYVLLIASAAVSLIGLMELYRVIGIHKTPLAVIGYFATAFYYVSLEVELGTGYEEHFPLMLVLFALVAFLFCYVLSYPKYQAKEVMGAFFGLLYVSVMLSYIYLTRDDIEGGKYLVWLIFLCSWGSDTLAYCTGMLFGKHKMTPKLSPKKTWEGAIGGVIGASLLTVLFAWIFREPMQLNTTKIIVLAVIAAAGAVISMIGDLAASAIKRNYDIKDYGKLIPGHGGILDRFDSVIFTAPIIFYLALFFI